MTPQPDRKFFSEQALKLCHAKIKKNKEPIIISYDCFWHISGKILDGIQYELYNFDREWANSHDFSTTFQYVFKDLLTAIQCNDLKYTDEIIYVGMPWELDKANKYFGNAMLINAYDYNKS